MQEDEFIKYIDAADKDLDAFPFWQKFKKACKANPIKGIDKLTPGRQAMLILWQANTQSRDLKGNLISYSLEGEDIEEKLQQLKDDLIGHFMNEEIDERALHIFFHSIVKKLK
tara:strand:- start:864 stop:1202 length:339 start_codon:yes stop_codon:yes gene_type:complete